MFCTKRSFLRGAQLVALFFCASLVSTVMLQAQTDPGPRPVGGAANSPCPIPSAKFPKAPPCIDNAQPPDAVGDDGAGQVLGNGGNLTGTWFEALTVFETKAAVGPGPQTGGATIPGLGPSFNSLSCFQCHSQPAVGGSSPNTATPGFPNGNPQTQLQSKAGANGSAPNQAQLTALTTAPTGFSPILSIDSAGNGNGPVREVRFPDGFAGDSTNFIDSVSNGAVANLFVVTSNIGAPAACTINQEPFQTEIQNHNVIFRIPIATFGEGFVENTSDDELERNAELSQTEASNLGISGIKFSVFNRSGNDQTISKFGWKAQNKSMLIFAGEAANVEMGVTNENFTNERTDGNGQCSPNFEPEDQTVSPPIIIASGSPLNDPRTIDGTSGLFATFGSPGVTSDISSDIENFAIFMRLNGAPSQCAFNSRTDSAGTAQCFSLTCTSATSGCVNPNPSQADVDSIQRGKKLFGSLDPGLPGSLTSNVADGNPATTSVATIGCVLCHSDSLTTVSSQAGSLNNAHFHPFSDFALHTMDPSLADGVTQGTATGQQFRTPPLWGIGQRLFFMHDGRAHDVLDAIKDHCVNSAATTPSEACAVFEKFNSLPATSGTTGAASKQDVLNFLRSL